MMNVMNGGAHAGWSTDFQEYMIIPVSAPNINDAVRMGAEVFHALAKILKERGYATTVGDEGGYAPSLREGNNEPLDLIMAAIQAAGYRPGEDVCIAMDVASSEFADGDHYTLKTNGDWKSSDDLNNWYQWIIDHYPVVSIEDGLGENDWDGWKEQTKRFGDRIQLVGDDLFVTNSKLLKKGIDNGVANSVLVKLNQIGSLSESCSATEVALFIPTCIWFLCPIASFPTDTATTTAATAAAPIPIFHGKSRGRGDLFFAFCFTAPLFFAAGTCSAAEILRFFVDSVSYTRCKSASESGVRFSCQSANSSSISCGR